jgi:hypothetical protein
MYALAAHNMEFSAMLAAEHALIVPSLFICSPGLTNKAEQQNITSTALTLLSFGSGLTNYRISAQQKALAVGSNTKMTHHKI